MSREYTVKILQFVEKGVIDKDLLIMNLLGWMSEDDVKSFYERHYQWDIEQLEEEEEELIS